MASLGNVNTQPGGRAHLFSLPNELQDIIFDLAYHRDSNIKIMPIHKIRREQSYQRQRAKPPDIITPARDPQVKVSDFMVSKQYFVGAGKAYIGSGPIAFKDTLFLHDLKLPVAFAREVESCFGTWALVSSTNLRSLRLSIAPADFLSAREEDGPELPVLKQPLSAGDFTQSPVSRKLDHFRGLTTFELVSDGIKHGGYDQEQQDNWKANVETFEDLLRSKVTRDRDEADAVGEQKNNSFRGTPLYPGSKVYCERKEQQYAANLVPPVDDSEVRARPTAQMESMVASVDREESSAGKKKAERHTTAKTDSAKEPRKTLFPKSRKTRTSLRKTRKIFVLRSRKVVVRTKKAKTKVRAEEPPPATEPRKILIPKSRKAVVMPLEAKTKAPADEHLAIKKSRPILIPKSRKAVERKEDTKGIPKAEEQPKGEQPKEEGPKKEEEEPEKELVCEPTASTASNATVPVTTYDLETSKITPAEEVPATSDAADPFLTESWRKAAADMQAMITQTRESNDNTKLALEWLAKVEQDCVSMGQKQDGMDTETAKQMQELKAFMSAVMFEATNAKTTKPERKTSTWWKIGVPFVVGAVLMWMCMVALAYHTDMCNWDSRYNRMGYGSLRLRHRYW